MELNRLVRISRNSLIIPFLWVFFFIISFRVLARFPSGIFEILFVLIVIITFSISIRQIILGWIQGGSNVYQLVLIPLFILPFIVAWQANKEFGQPYFLGLLAQRQHFIIFAGYFLLFMLQRKKITLEKLERYLILASLIIMVIMGFFSIFINPTQFNNTDDFKLYPKTLEADLDLLRKTGVDYCLLPDTHALYPEGYRFRIE